MSRPEVLRERDLAPIAVFAFNRPRLLRDTLASLAENTLAALSDLTVVSDGPRSAADERAVREVRNIAETQEGFRSVTLTRHEHNRGLAQNITSGVTKLVAKAGSVIVLEDDLLTGRYFLEFMNDGLKTHADSEHVAQICGYSYFENFAERFKLDATICIKGADCLGWATWERAWRHFTPDGADLAKTIRALGLIPAFNKNGAFDFFKLLERSENNRNSWAVQWYASAFLRDMFTVYPSKSLVLHVGANAGATNYVVRSGPDPLAVRLSNERPERVSQQVGLQPNAELVYQTFLASLSAATTASPLTRILRQIKKRTPRRQKGTTSHE